MILRLPPTLLLVSVLASCTNPAPVTEGPPGPVGPTGPQGERGATGEQGPPGEVLVLDGGVITGPPGPQGASVTVTTVPPGSMCPAGGVLIGIEGTQVTQLMCNGVAGATGPQGPAGPQGPVGPQGTQGPQGVAGVAGATGATGAQGPAGATGPQGVAGPAGPAGQSVVTTVLAAGDAVCSYGGAKFTVGTSSTYACNGAPGGVGPPGASAPGDAGIFDLSEAYSFAGFTSATYNGALGGLVGANAKCHSEFAGAHLCTVREYYWIGVGAPVPAGGAWVDNAYYGSSSSPNQWPRDRYFDRTCDDWTISDSVEYGGYLDSNGQRTTGPGVCQVARSLACCRSSVAFFRGFTPGAWDGNLGGVNGANAKCAAAFPGSRFCTVREYLWAGASTGIPANGAWVDNAYYGSSSSPNQWPRDRYFDRTCDDWTTNSATEYGGHLDANGERTTGPGLCTTARPLACCGR